MKKTISYFVVFIFAFCIGAYANPSEDAQALFAQGKFLQGRDILIKALNDPDPARRASAILAYGRFYDNIVGNTDYAFNFYNDAARINLPQADPVKSAAQKEADKIRQLRLQYQSQDALLKKLQLSQAAGPDENRKLITQLLAITKQPDYYRLSEVYYQLGRKYFAVKDYRNAYVSLKKSLELKPGVNFYLPVNVWIDSAYGKWVRAVIHNITWSILGGLLILTIVVFYASKPWNWLKFRHLIIGFSMVLLWLIVFGLTYLWFAGRPAAPEKTMFEAGVVPPYFFSFGPDGPYWKVAQNLFIYGLIGVIGVFVFSIGLAKLRCRWVASLINIAFAILLFTSLSTVFYIRNCDQKSTFGPQVSGNVWHYLKGDNYFVNFGMEPYVLTNPKGYPDLATNNLADPYLLHWVLKYCPFKLQPDNKSKP